MMTIDFAKPIQTIDGDVAEKIRELTHPEFKHVVLVTDSHSDSQTMVTVDDGGNTGDMVGYIENVDPDDAHPAIEETPELPRLTILDIPSHLNLRVMHQKRGAGRLVKLREAPAGRPGKTLGIRLDSGAVSGDGGVLWAIDKYVSVIR